MITYASRSESETFALGESLAAALTSGSNVLFYGDLGAGKTAMIRGICHALGVDSTDINSPTFTIVNEYHGQHLKIYHMDAYRLTPTDFLDGGFDEYLEQENTVCLIEWAENLPEIPQAITVHITGSGEEERTINVIPMP